MKLVLVNNTSDLNIPTILDTMEQNIDFCNKAFKKLLAPIDYYFADLSNVGLDIAEESFNNHDDIIVEVNYLDFMALNELTTLLSSNNTRKNFETIQKDLKEDKEKLSTLNNITVWELELLYNHCKNNEYIAKFMIWFKKLLETDLPKARYYDIFYI